MRQFVPERATFGLDVYINSEDAEKCHEELSQYVSETSYFSNTHRYYILKRDLISLTVIHCSFEWINHALEAAQTNLDPVSQEPKLPFEWIILSKMSHGRRQDFMDCARMIARAGLIELKATKELLETWYPSALPDLRKLYTVGKQEVNLASEFRNESPKLNDWQYIAAHYQEYSDSDLTEVLQNDERITFPNSWDDILIHYT